MAFNEAHAILLDAADPRYWPRRHSEEPIYGAAEAARHVEALVEHHHGPTMLRAFTIRIRTKQTEGSIASIFAIARRHGWRAFMGNPETTEYDVIAFVNEAAPV